MTVYVEKIPTGAHLHTHTSTRIRFERKGGSKVVEGKAKSGKPIGNVGRD